jgi:transposase
MGLIMDTMSSAFIKKYKARGGGTVIQVVFKDGRSVTRTVHIGTAHTEDDLELLIAFARDTIRGEQLQMDLFDAPKDGVDLIMQGAFPELLWATLSGVYDKLGFSSLEDDTFSQLVLSRLIEPSSKLDTIRILDEIGQSPPSTSGIQRCLRRCIDDDYRSSISKCCFDAATAGSLSLLLYDVTTLYFEVQKEDGYRKPGMSKERRLDPQITVGLLVGRDGFPLEIKSFEGNRAEVKTIMEVLDGFKARHGIDELTVTADAAMLSSKNIQALEDMGYHYIIGSRIAKVPYDIAEYAKEPGAELADGQIFDTRQAMNTGRGTKRITRRVIYQYRKDRASLDLRNIDKLLDKANKMLSGASEFKRNRFLKVEGGTKTINTELVARSRLKAGIKGYVTDLDIEPREVIAAYHQLFEVERSFRMSKSDLKARPVFHRKRDSIEAHLTVVFTALAVARYIQAATGMSIKRFIRTLKPIQTGILLVNGKKRLVRPMVSDAARKPLRALEDYRK